jgi:hypothetical protein
MVHRAGVQRCRSRDPGAGAGGWNAAAPSSWGARGAAAALVAPVLFSYSFGYCGQEFRYLN